MLNSTLSANTALQGGGISNLGALTLTNSTLSGNSATSSGGGILNSSGATLTIQSSTLSDNRAPFGGGIANEFGTLNIGNTILKAGTQGRNLENASGTVNSQGYNLSSAASGPSNGTTDRININPLLRPLADNDGPTQTHALLTGSPAIDMGNTTLTVDQRGVTRPQGNADDIGAFEVVQVSCSLITAQVSGGGFIRTTQFSSLAIITVTVSGGAAPYIITLDNNGGTQTGPSPLLFRLRPPATTTYTVTAGTDANNCPITPSGSATITLDDTPPIIVCPANQTVVIAGTSGPVTYALPSFSDNNPGARIICTPDARDTFALGTTPVYCTAIDEAGNTAACSFTVTVRQPRPAIKDLITKVRALVPPLSTAQANQLIGHLELANTRLERGQTSQACTHLQNFVNAVNAFVNGGQLTMAQGQALIDYANKIRNAVGCGG